MARDNVAEADLRGLAVRFDTVATIAPQRSGSNVPLAVASSELIKGVGPKRMRAWKPRCRLHAIDLT